MESRLSMEVLPKIKYPELCKEIVDIKQADLQSRIEISRLRNEGVEIDDAALALIRGAVSVRVLDVIAIRRAN